MKRFVLGLVVGLVLATSVTAAWAASTRDLWHKRSFTVDCTAVASTSFDSGGYVMCIPLYGRYAAAISGDDLNIYRLYPDDRDPKLIWSRTQLP